MSVVIPPQVVKYFWGDNLTELDWQKNQRYIVQVVLDNGDQHAISWLFGQLSVRELVRLLPSLKLKPKSKNFWNIYFS